MTCSEGNSWLTLSLSISILLLALAPAKVVSCSLPRLNLSSAQNQSNTALPRGVHGLNYDMYLSHNDSYNYEDSPSFMPAMLLFHPNALIRDLPSLTIVCVRNGHKSTDHLPKTLLQCIFTSLSPLLSTKGE